jgi:hypothetical protein
MKTFSYLWQKNILDKPCTENRNALLYSTTCFRKSCRLWDIVEKKWGSQRDHMTSQYGAHELHAAEARLHARTRMHTPMLPAHARTLTDVIFIVLPRQQ